MLLKASPLKKGDTIGFFSPSSPATVFAPNRFERAKTFLEGKGYRLLAGNLTGRNDFYRSGTIAERANELNELIRNPDVRCIMSVIGGMNANSLLPYIDYQSLEKDPKIIIGYSDTTALLLGIYSRINLVTFYGSALIASFGELGSFVEETYQYFADILQKMPDLPHKIKNPAFWTDEFIAWETQTTEKTKHLNQLFTLNAGIAEGRLIVGNLNTIAGIFGSPFMPKIQSGDILLIEDSLKDAAHIERAFSHLKINGIFDIIGGLIVGKHEGFNDLQTGRKPYEILKEVIGNTKIPILAEFDCCHTHPMISLPIGIPVRLDATSQTLSLLDTWLSV